MQMWGGGESSSKFKKKKRADSAHLVSLHEEQHEAIIQHTASLDFNDIVGSLRADCVLVDLTAA